MCEPFEELPTFDVMLDMAKNKPEELEALRANLCHHIIQSVEDEGRRQRLRGLQFQVDAKRRTAKSPMSACIHISNMMHHALNRLNAVLNDAECVASITADHSLPEKKTKILQFPGSQ